METPAPGDPAQSAGSSLSSPDPVDWGIFRAPGAGGTQWPQLLTTGSEHQQNHARGATVSGEEVIPLLTLILIPWYFHESGDGKDNLEFYFAILTPRPLQTIYPRCGLIWSIGGRRADTLHRALPSKPPPVCFLSRPVPLPQHLGRLGDYSSPEQKYRQTGSGPPSYTEKSDWMFVIFHEKR